MKLLKLLMLPLMISCQSGQIEKLRDGLIVHLGDSVTRVVKIQVLADDIIHVAASPDNTIDDQPGLVIGKHAPPFQKWDYSKKGNSIVISTEKLRTEISLSSGEISFKDAAGNIILSEPKGGGKSFIPVYINSTPFYSIRQIFESPDDEAFYGLGQHQNRQMNYKGADVDLTQHNIVAVVPFLFSSRNFGILWDNYSITRFGDPRDYGPVSTLSLFSKDGKPGGLSASYYHKNKLVLSRQENSIDYQYIESAGNWPDVLPMTDAKVIWDGAFSSDIDGVHKFTLYASEYFKLWIDDKLILDKWRQNWNPWYNKFTVRMKKGEKHTIRLEWVPNNGYMALLHLNPLDEKDQKNLSLFSEVGKQIDYYFIYGKNADEVISGYRQITGKAPIMPEWAMGLWQSRERYKTQEELIDVVREFRKRKIPVDNIVLDWFYWKKDQWGSHEFDPERFPDPVGMVNELHDSLHVNIMISVWPKFYKGTAHFDEMQEKGFLYQRNLEKNRKDWVGYVSTFYDPFNPGAGKLFWKQINDNLNSKGFDAWWLDATEPDMQSNHSIDERKIMMSPTYLGSGSQYFNAFSLQNSKAVYDGLREANPEKRVLILTRSAFAGQQRYAAATWSGDVASRWSDLGDQISAGLNFCISGIPYWTHDIGGFSLERRFENPKDGDLDEWRELNVRWFQFGAFCPIFRVHGQFPYREMFNIAPANHPVYQSMLYYDKLRYRLMPYIYSLAGKTYHDDYTIMRALIMDFPEDTAVYDINDQYMFGPSIMVCPVHEYKVRQREIYLPSGYGWYDFYTGKYYKGGRTITAAAPLDRIPLFVREGSIIPAGPDIQYTGEKAADPVDIYLYGGKDAVFSLYEDEGINYNYENGMYSKIDISYSENSGELTFAERTGEFEGMLKSRTFRISKIDPENPLGIDEKSDKTGQVLYNGSPCQLKLR
jgi:alpha-D-xyloside xylohydrolase